MGYLRIRTQDCSQYSHFRKKFNPPIRGSIYKIVNLITGYPTANADERHVSTYSLFLGTRIAEQPDKRDFLLKESLFCSIKLSLRTSH